MLSSVKQTYQRKKKPKLLEKDFQKYAKDQKLEHIVHYLFKGM